MFSFSFYDSVGLVLLLLRLLPLASDKGSLEAADAFF